MVLPYTAVVRQEVGPRDTVVALVSSDMAMTLQATPVVLQEDSYGRTLAVLLVGRCCRCCRLGLCQDRALSYSRGQQSMYSALLCQAPTVARTLVLM